MSDLYVTCRRCSGWGSIETSQSEDGRFSYQDQCPECSSQGVVPTTPADVLAYLRTLPGVMTAETVMDLKQFRSWYIPMDEPGTYLLVPLLKEE